MQVGFIGIGVMGRPMTLNLLKAEHHVTIYARHPDKPEVQEVLNASAKLAPSPRAVAMASDIVITMLDRKSTRLNSSHSQISYAVFCLKKKKHNYVCKSLTQ